MSNIFAGKKGVAEDTVEEDFLGGGGVLDTDLYTATIKTAYLSKSGSSDARALNLILDIQGKEVRQQIWMTNGKGDVTYKDKKTGKDRNLPGYSQVTSLCLLVTGKEVGNMDVEEVTVKIYDYDAKKELPQAVYCFVELHGETVNIALQRQTVDKTKKDDNTGKYEPTGETRDQNEVVKFFASDKLVTISEVAEFIKGLGGNFNDEIENGNILKAISQMQDEHGNYADKWLEKNKNQTYDKSKGKSSGGKSFDGGSSGNDGEAKSAKKTSLFD